MKRTALIGGALLTLTACGSGSYSDAMELREALEDSGHECPDYEEKEPGTAVSSAVNCEYADGLHQTGLIVYTGPEGVQSDIAAVRQQRDAGTLITIPCFITGGDWSVAFVRLSTVAAQPVDCEAVADELGGEVTT